MLENNNQTNMDNSQALIFFQALEMHDNTYLADAMLIYGMTPDDDRNISFYCGAVKDGKSYQMVYTDEDSFSRQPVKSATERRKHSFKEIGESFLDTAYYGICVNRFGDDDGVFIDYRQMAEILGMDPDDLYMDPDVFCKKLVGSWECQRNLEFHDQPEKVSHRDVMTFGESGEFTRSFERHYEESTEYGGIQHYLFRMVAKGRWTRSHNHIDMKKLKAYRCEEKCWISTENCDLADVGKLKLLQDGEAYQYQMRGNKLNLEALLYSEVGTFCKTFNEDDYVYGIFVDGQLSLSSACTSKKHVYSRIEFEPFTTIEEFSVRNAILRPDFIFKESLKNHLNDYIADMIVYVACNSQSNRPYKTIDNKDYFYLYTDLAAFEKGNHGKFATAYRLRDYLLHDISDFDDMHGVIVNRFNDTDQPGTILNFDDLEQILGVSQVKFMKPSSKRFQFHKAYQDHDAYYLSRIYYLVPFTRDAYDANRYHIIYKKTAKGYYYLAFSDENMLKQSSTTYDKVLEVPLNKIKDWLKDNPVKGILVNGSDTEQGVFFDKKEIAEALGRRVE